MEAPALPQHSTAITARPGDRPARAPVGYRTPGASRPQLALPALATAGILYCCYFPVAWGWLAWVALVPLLALVRAEASKRRIFFCAWLGGLAFFWPVLRWMPVADHRMYYTWAALATYCSFYFPVAVLLIRRLDRDTRLPLVVTVPAVWVALEFARSYLLTGFAWYYLAHTQHQFLPMIQVSDLGGAYTVSLLVAAVNAWLFEALYTWGRFREVLGLAAEPASPQRAPVAWKRLGLHGVCVFGLVVAALGYGAYRLEEQTQTPGPRISLLQGNLDQRLRNAAGGSVAGVDPDDARSRMFSHFFNLVMDTKRSGLNPELIVWPETSFDRPWAAIAPDVLLDRAPESWKRWHDRTLREFRNFVQNWCGADTLFGLNTVVLADASGKEIRHNSALLMRAADGATAGRYDKLHRVPFGEYVPFRDWLPFMDAFAPYDNDYSITAGEKLVRFEQGKYRFGVLVCFEDTDPFLARAYGRATDDGPAADFLVNISNDGWFDGSAEHDEHLAVSRFRAIEARRALARSVNMGISAVIDGNGRVLAPQELARIDWPRHQRKMNTEAWVQDPTSGRISVTMRAVNTGYRVELAMPDAKHTGKEKMDGWRLPWPKETSHLWACGGGIPAEDLPVSRWSEFKKVAGVLTAVVPIDSRTSLYSLWGDWLAGGCLAVMLGGWVFARRARRRRLAAAAA